MQASSRTVGTLWLPPAPTSCSRLVLRGLQSWHDLLLPWPSAARLPPFLECAPSLGCRALLHPRHPLAHRFCSELSSLSSAAQPHGGLAVLCAGCPGQVSTTVPLHEKGRGHFLSYLAPASVNRALSHSPPCVSGGFKLLHGSGDLYSQHRVALRVVILCLPGCKADSTVGEGTWGQSPQEPRCSPCHPVAVMSQL